MIFFINTTLLSITLDKGIDECVIKSKKEKLPFYEKKEKIQVQILTRY